MLSDRSAILCILVLLADYLNSSPCTRVFWELLLNIVHSNGRMVILLEYHPIFLLLFLHHHCYGSFSVFNYEKCQINAKSREYNAPRHPFSIIINSWPISFYPSSHALPPPYTHTHTVYFEAKPRYNFINVSVYTSKE